MNIAELLEFTTAATQRVRDFLEAADPERLHELVLELAAAGGALAVVAQHIRAIAEGQPPLTAEELNFQVVLNAAALAGSGQISQEEFDEVMAVATLREQGIADPTELQVQERISELRTAGSFVSSIPAPSV